MKLFIATLVLLSSSPVLAAGGSWGGGTPPASRIFEYVIADFNDVQITTLGKTVDHIEYSNLPQVRSHSFIESDDGYTLIPIAPPEVDRMLKQIKRKGSAGVIVDSDRVLEFVFRDGYLENLDNAVRVVIKPKFE